MSAVLMVDGALPAREASAGERATFDLIDGLQALGHEVHFTALGFNAEDGLRSEAMHRAGIHLLAGHGQGLDHLRTVIGSRHYDVVIVHRPGPALAVQAALVGTPAATIYIGHDVHQWRLSAQQRLQSDVQPHRLLAMQVAERRCWQGYDLSVYPTDREADFVRDAGYPAFAMPYYRLTAQDLPPLEGHGPRSGLLMVGASFHAPNKDAVGVAVTEVLPLTRERVTVVGDWPLRDRKPLMAPGVTFTGRVDEQVLRELHQTHLALLAPLRFGAGTRRKLVAAMGLGLPVITTSEGLRGLLVRDAIADDPVLVADTPAEMAAHIDRLRRDPEWGATMAGRAQACVASIYGEDNFDAGVQDALNSVVSMRDGDVS
jgi:glycosyltransferase involved in cell wall biosynthesis